MGFCLFSNIAIGALHAIESAGAGRVAIMDFDVHHGNGTQHIFEDDETVFYYSIHEHPSFAYPGTGREFDTGVSGGKGFTLNTPVLPGHVSLFAQSGGVGEVIHNGLHELGAGIRMYASNGNACDVTIGFYMMT